jgi:hypothetical protein
VVFVSAASDFLLADAREALERTLSRRPQADHAIVFGYWISMKADCKKRGTAEWSAA